MMPDALPVTLLEHALSYAARGLQVFPVKESNKAPYTEHGMKDATSDPAQIVKWWTEHPGALIGCRIPPDRVVLDIDPRHGGDKTWDELERAYAPIAVGRQHHSGRNDGGFHAWAIRPAGKLQARPLHEWARKNGVGQASGKRSWTSGIDILHHNHRYTILPPSPHPETGEPYQWDIEGAPVELPGFVVALITEQPRPPQQSIRVVRDADSIADWFTANHSWHDILPAAGWQLVSGDGDGDGSKWRHPNASAESSASVRHGCLFVYSDNTDFPVTEEADPNGLTRFRAWSILEHDEDMTSAARAARERKDGPSPEYGAAEPFDPDAPWPEPQPLGTRYRPPPFPVDALPSWMAAHVRQVAAEFQVAADLPAMLAITAMSICCARRASVIVQGTWREPLCIYSATAAPPGEGKSPVVRQTIGFLDRYERDLIERTARDRDDARVRRAILEKQHTKAINAGDTAEAMATADDLRDIPEPVEPRLMADDVTPEKLAEMIAEHGGRIALVSTEGGVFGLMTGRYSEKSNLDVYLKAWSGDAIRIDRLGRRAAGVVLDPALTVGLTVQPTVIRDLAEHPELAGRGLTARFMYAFPPSSVGHRTMGRDPAINRVVAAEYERRLLELIERMEPMIHDVNTITLDADARATYFAWRQDMEDRCRVGGDLHHMVEWVTKLGSTVARLAGLLAVTEDRWMVDGATMERAITIGRYWEAQARIAHDMWAGTGVVLGRAEKVVDWLASEQPGEFTLRDVYMSVRSLTAEDAADVLHLLVDKSWIRQVDQLPVKAGRRGVPSPKFVPHPDLSHVRNNHARLHIMPLNNYLDQSSSSSEGIGERDAGVHDVHDVHDVIDAEERPEPGAPVDNSDDKEPLF